MLNIAICDDDALERKQLHTLLDNYGQRETGCPFSRTEFVSAAALAETILHGKSYDINLLDIYMKGMNGMELAQQIRQLGINSPLIFLTTSTSHALEAFGVQATQYLLKPVNPDKLFATLDIAVQIVDRERQKHLLIKTDNGYRQLAFTNIVYTEAHDKIQYLHLKNGEVIKTRMTTTKLAERLTRDAAFARCGVAYVINLGCIKSLDTKNVYLTNGELIPIPRHAYTDLHKCYFAYYFEK